MLIYILAFSLYLSKAWGEEFISNNKGRKILSILWMNIVSQNMPFIYILILEEIKELPHVLVCQTISQILFIDVEQKNSFQTMNADKFPVFYKWILFLKICHSSAFLFWRKLKSVHTFYYVKQFLRFSSQMSSKRIHFKQWMPENSQYFMNEYYFSKYAIHLNYNSGGN